MKKYLKLLPLLAAGLTAMGFKNVSASDKNLTFTLKNFRLCVNFN